MPVKFDLKLLKSFEKSLWPQFLSSRPTTIYAGFFENNKRQSFYRKSEFCLMCFEIFWCIIIINLCLRCLYAYKYFYFFFFLWFQ